MAKSIPSLLDQIETGALDGQAPLADVLRKCVVLVDARALPACATGHAASSTATATARSTCRPTGSCAQPSASTERMSPRWLEVKTIPLGNPEFARETITDEALIPYGAAEPEKLASSTDTLHLRHPGMPDLITYMNSQAPFGTSYQSMYWAVAQQASTGSSTSSGPTW